jgi:hypothetical protein
MLARRSLVPGRRGRREKFRWPQLSHSHGLTSDVRIVGGLSIIDYRLLPFSTRATLSLFRLSTPPVSRHSHRRAPHSCKPDTIVSKFSSLRTEPFSGCLDALSDSFGVDHLLHPPLPSGRQVPCKSPGPPSCTTLFSGRIDASSFCLGFVGCCTPLLSLAISWFCSGLQVPCKSPGPPSCTTLFSGRTDTLSFCLGLVVCCTPLLLAVSLVLPHRVLH